MAVSLSAPHPAAPVSHLVAALVAPDNPAGCLARVEEALAQGTGSWTAEGALPRARAMGFTALQAERLVRCAELTEALDRESWVLPAPVTGPADVLALVADIRASAKEHVVAIYLDARNRPVHREPVAQGGLRSSVIQPRDILAPALSHGAAGLILVHNHPSGDTTPSREDLEVSRQLAAGARLLGLELLDHLVVSRTRCSSLRELGHL